MLKMERGRCLMSTKRQILKPDYYPSPAFQLSAFPRNATSFSEEPGGNNFLWPPRSYSCSFCSREFRSAQALGGHMNVHRRDRARLKQQSLNTNSNKETLIHHGRESQEIQKTPVVVKRSNLQECATCPEDDHQEVRTDLSVGLNSAFCSTESEMSTCKRARTTDSSSRLSPFLDEFIGFKSINHGDLDLELRLGADPPKVK